MATNETDEKFGPPELQSFMFTANMTQEDLSEVQADMINSGIKLHCHQINNLHACITSSVVNLSTNTVLGGDTKSGLVIPIPVFLYLIQMVQQELSNAGFVQYADPNSEVIKAKLN